MEKMEIKINNIAKELKNRKIIDYNVENFYSTYDKKRYNGFLNNIILKNVSNIDGIYDSLVEKNGKGNDFYGIYTNGDNVICAIPNRNYLFDEMKCIHEITHLVNYIETGIIDESLSYEVIPYFNEYDYLRKIHSFYGKYYEKHRLYTSVNIAKNMNEENQKDCLAHIYAYLLLEEYKNNYDIEVLNKINATGEITKGLTKKGYTLHL